MDINTYLSIKKRLCSHHEGSCCTCPLGTRRNGKSMACTRFELEYPERAQSILEEWNKTHPAKTYMFCLKDKFPDTDEDIISLTICPGHLFKNGPVNKNCKSKFKCTNCWNQEVD